MFYFGFILHGSYIVFRTTDIRFDWTRVDWDSRVDVLATTLFPSFWMISWFSNTLYLHDAHATSLYIDIEIVNIIEFSPMFKTNTSTTQCVVCDVVSYPWSFLPLWGNSEVTLKQLRGNSEVNQSYPELYDSELEGFESESLSFDWTRVDWDSRVRCVNHYIYSLYLNDFLITTSIPSIWMISWYINPTHTSNTK